jgi:histidine ammonia-lyase
MIIIDGKSLSIQEIRQVAIEGEKISLSQEAADKIHQSREWVEDIINRGDPVYGINTGFGIFADRQISSHETRLLNRNLILSHAVGTGDPLPREVVRAAILIRANTLAKGFSGVRPLLIETLLEMLNRGIHPVIPSQGSLGSSGDLAPLSHLALVLSTDEEDLDQLSGFAEFEGILTSGKEAMNKAGIPRIILEAKEGIALNNGATFSAAIAALACSDAENLLSAAEISLSMSLEALLGISSAFDPRIHESRQHPGQIAVAERVRELTRGSSLLDSTNRVQDAYSLRCSPQVQEIAGIAERRVFRLTDGRLNENLPSMLVDQHQDAGLNSGMMMPQYTAASLVLENRSLATPDSTYSLPTSAAQEDHNANSMTAARHTRQIINNTAHVLAIELYTAARALDLRIREMPHAKLGIGTSAAFRCIRDAVPYQAGDALWGPEIDTVRGLIIARDITSAVEKAK